MLLDGLLETVGFKKMTECVDDEQARMRDGSEFQTEGAATLKPWEAKVLQTRGTDNRLALEEH